MPATAMTFLPANLARATNSLMALRERYEQFFAGESQRGWLDLCQRGDPAKTHHLLRYAVLAPSKTTRDQVLAKSRARKIGITPLYHQTLPRVNGIPVISGDDADSRYPNATRFADRLITLPFYAGLSDADLINIEAIIQD